MSEKLTRSEWTRTPYAKTTAANTHGDVKRLLAKYEITDWQWTSGQMNGRQAVQLRFAYQGAPYTITARVLDADASDEELLRQVERAVFHYLKSLVEISGPFFPLSQVLATHLQLEDGQTVGQLVEANRDALPAIRQKLLIGPGGES
ncbi:MAG TPA: hypothetical protein VLV83_24870 [Acidobacteriota bacterium]|nr:hypothetical protein [Acidobacteriota bacterium]